MPSPIEAVAQHVMVVRFRLDCAMCGKAKAGDAQPVDVEVVG
jgi:hypothetical protein